MSSTIMTTQQKQTYVKEQLTQALLELLKEKPLSQISIRELTDRAEVARVSFYRSYASKEDILREESERLLQEWGTRYESDPDSSPETLLPSLFDFYRQYQQFCLILCEAGLSSIMLEAIQQAIPITPQTSSLEAYTKSFWAYGIYGWLIEWIKRGMPESGEDLLTLFEQANQQN